MSDSNSVDELREYASRLVRIPRWRVHFADLPPDTVLFLEPYARLRLIDLGSKGGFVAHEEWVEQSLIALQHSFQTEITSRFPGASAFGVESVAQSELRTAKDEQRSLDSLLDELTKGRSGRELSSVLEQLRRYFTVPGTNDKFVILIRNGALPPVARWALLELLTEIGDSRVVELAMEGLAEGVLSEFTVGSLIALRLTADLDSASVRSAVIEIIAHIETNLDEPAGLNTMNRRVLQEAVLTLGEFALAEDVSLLRQLLDRDFANICSSQVLSVLTWIMSSETIAIEDDEWQQLLGTCKELLSVWGHRRSMSGLESFSRASQVIELLCSRLESDGLAIALEAVKLSGSRALAERMSHHVSRVCQNRRSIGEGESKRATEIVASLRKLYD